MNKLKVFLVSSLLCLTIVSFAQSSAKYTPIQEGEYLLKIMMTEMTLDHERMSQIRLAIYTAAKEEQKFVDVVGERKDETIKTDIKNLKTERDEKIKAVLTEEEFEYYEDILEDLYAKIYDLNKGK